MSRKKKNPAARSPAAVVLEPYAALIRRLAIPFRLTNNGKWEGMVTAAEILDEARAVNVDVPDVDADAIERLARAVSLLREAGEILREVGADVASALAVAGGPPGAPLPSSTWTKERRLDAPLPPAVLGLNPTDITNPRGLLELARTPGPKTVEVEHDAHGNPRITRITHTANGRPLPPPGPPGAELTWRVETLNKADRALLSVLVARSPQPTTRVQLSILSGYSGKSSSFQNALGKLRRLKLAGDEGPLIFATKEGLAAAPDVPPLPKGPELRRYWLSRANKAERALLEVLIDVYPRQIDKDELARRARYSATSSSFQNALGKLRSLELVRGLRASDEFMEDA